MSAPAPFDDADLHAYADGQLPPERANAFEVELARDAVLAGALADIRAQNASLRRALDPILLEPIPPELVRAAVPPSRGTRIGHALHRFGPVLATAAALLVVQARRHVNTDDTA